MNEFQQLGYGQQFAPQGFTGGALAGAIGRGIGAQPGQFGQAGGFIGADPLSAACAQLAQQQQLQQQQQPGMQAGPQGWAGIQGSGQQHPLLQHLQQAQFHHQVLQQHLQQLQQHLAQHQQVQQQLQQQIQQHLAWQAMQGQPQGWAQAGVPQMGAWGGIGAQFGRQVPFGPSPEPWAGYGQQAGAQMQQPFMGYPGAQVAPGMPQQQGVSFGGQQTLH